MTLFCLVVGFLLTHRSVKCPPLRCCTYLGHLVVDFFKYFGTQFPYDKMALSLRAGGGLVDKRPLGFTRQLSVESPLRTKVDVGVHDFDRHMAAFAQAYETITTLIATKNPVRVFPWLLDGEHVMILRPAGPGDVTRFDARPDVADMDEDI